MAISDLLPRKAMGSKTRGQTLHDRLDYDQKKEKTEDGELVSSYMCCPETAAEEFEMSKLIYETSTGRSQPKDRDIIAYRIIQSFKPGEITPEEANKLGYELAMRFTKGKHQFVVSTHVDKAHIHNHVEFNSTNLECDGKFNNYKNSSFALRRLNDQICREHGYSVIENPKAKGQRYQEKAAAKRGRSFKERLRQTIDGALPGCRDFEEFLSRMRAEGYEIKRRGKSLEFRAPEQENFTRSFRLGEDYTEAALRERTGKARTGMETKSKRQTAARNVNLLVDIQAKMQAGKGKGYERWAKKFNLKEMAKTVMYLQENNLLDYAVLQDACTDASEKYNAMAAKTKANSERMKEIFELEKHIGVYRKNRDIYAEYRRLPIKKQMAFYEQHRSQIVLCEAAKKFFDELGLQKLPGIQMLKQEYAELQAENKKLYPEQKRQRAKMLELLTARSNVERILGLQDIEQQREKQRQIDR